MLLQKNVTVPFMQWAASFPKTFRGLILVGSKIQLRLIQGVQSRVKQMTTFSSGILKEFQIQLLISFYPMSFISLSTLSSL